MVTKTIGFHNSTRVMISSFLKLASMTASQERKYVFLCIALQASSNSSCYTHHCPVAKTNSIECPSMPLAVFCHLVPHECHLSHGSFNQTNTLRKHESASLHLVCTSLSVQHSQSLAIKTQTSIHVNIRLTETIQLSRCLPKLTRN